MALFTPTIARLRALPAAALLLGASLTAQAQAPTPIAITGSASVYRQDFDVLTPNGTTYPDGWTGIRYAKSATATTTVNETLPPVVLVDGSASGAVYNAGPNVNATNENDRALGTLGSGSTAPAFGAVFVNRSGAAITRVTMTARHEQWRTGSLATVNEKVIFEYSLDATNLNSGTTAVWTPVTNLDLNELSVTSAVAGPQDGNAAANSKFIGGVVTGLSWPAGGTMWIRWRDTDDAGSDALMAIDDFALAVGNTTLANQNKALQAALNIFPNPATNSITLQIGKDGVGASVEIFNAMGQRVQQTTAVKESLSLDVSALRSGVYTVRFTTGGGTATRSFVKQ